MAVKVELRRFADGRLMLVVFFTEGSNLWKHDNTFSWVPSKQELELINEGLEAIDSYNMFKKNLKGLKAEN